MSSDKNIKASDSIFKKLDALTKISWARQWAVNKCPYFSSILLSFVPHESKQLTIGPLGVTERLVLIYNPDLMTKMTLPELGTILLHETNHIIREYHKRVKEYGFEPYLYNLAQDAAINQDLLAINPEFEKGSYFFPKNIPAPNGKTSEEYYHLIKDIRDKMPKNQGVGKGGCGSCAGHPMEGEPDTGTEPGRSATEIERIKKNVAEDIVSHKKNAGNVPDGILRWAEEFIKPPKIRWQEKLQRYIRQAISYRSGMVDLTYNKISRRQAGVGFGIGKPVMPAFRAPKIEVCVAIDTSGSMGKEELEPALAEVNGVLKATGSAINFITCDCSVHTSKQINTVKEAVNSLVGGGGTDFHPIIEAVSKNKNKTHLLVICTDGVGGAPKTAPIGYSVIWLLVGKNTQIPATWGEVIKIED